MAAKRKSRTKPKTGKTESPVKVTKDDIEATAPAEPPAAVDLSTAGDDQDAKPVGPNRGPLIRGRGGSTGVGRGRAAVPVRHHAFRRS